ncbi:ABC transporter ATP-binding protein [Bacillus sp. FSL K6-0268]|uniref:ABC transporter ATP-binding protein n=1 Tax=Bacillus sp. FSL K6-0268 TaxID=2921449 RepID=UPI0030FCE4E2
MLNVKHLNKTYDEKQILNNISFSIESNVIYGILGTNGVGKTTTLKIISGLLAPTKGEIHLNGKSQDLTSGSLLQEIGFVPDKSDLYEYLTGEEYLRFVGKLYHLTDEEINVFVKNILSQFKLTDSSHQLIKNYSHGMKQKISIASGLIHNPKLLILDEPLTGIDLISTRTIKNTLKDYVKKGNIVLLSTHLLELAHSFCDKIGIIHNGLLASEFYISEYTLAELEKKVENIYLENTN